MKKDIPRNERPLSRKEMLERHRRQDYQDSGNELSEFSRRALAGLQYHPGDEPLEATLRRIDRKTGGAAGRSFPIRQFLSIAAAAALLLIGGYFLIQQPPGHEALFARHFDYLPSAVETRGGARADGPAAYEETAGARDKAMQAYEAGEYQQARRLMEEYLSENKRDNEVRLYLGIVLLGEGDPAGAIDNLEAALANLPQPAYERPARWYLALAYLRNGQPEQARALLAALKNGNDRYATASRALSGQL
ncbi:MAG: tetratricopeptide repeat protein [Phaeodactylibacter sp.]|nr:tetratricopeptide repeat protein [Phaeodactylibacter sp.]MCB9297650.1 tetratricopeptide repeat protein [Lewinellaceae bacterium]